MTVLGMPEPMFIVFVATIFAGSLGGIHYVFVHVLLGKPVNDTTQDRTVEGDNSLKDQTADGGITDARR